MIWSKRKSHPTQIDSSNDVLIVFDYIDCHDCYWLFLMYWFFFHHDHDDGKQFLRRMQKNTVG